MNGLIWLDDHSAFPPTRQALQEPNGLLAVGGDLSFPRLEQAYRQGIFPWYSEGQPILWWSPSPRMVLVPGKLHVGRTTRKLLRKHPFTLTVDQAFDQVVLACARAPRQGQLGTWITDAMMRAYSELFQRKCAHSVEVWHRDELVGGLYGVSFGRAFFGESMFSAQSGASKIAFVVLARALAAWGYPLIDCQMHTDYLASLGAREVPRESFERELAHALSLEKKIDWPSAWKALEFMHGEHDRT